MRNFAVTIMCTIKRLQRYLRAGKNTVWFAVQSLDVATSDGLSYTAVDGRVGEELLSGTVARTR